MKKVIKLKESELIGMIQKILNESPMGSNPVDGARIISVFRDGNNGKIELSLTSSQKQTLPRCKRDNNNACFDFPETLPQGLQTKEKNGCRNCVFYINYKREKFACTWSSPCKSVS